MTQVFILVKMKLDIALDIIILYFVNFHFALIIKMRRINEKMTDEM